MSNGYKRIVWVLTAVMAILIAVATSLFIGNRLKGTTSNVASAETAAPASTSGDIMPASLLVGSDNYHAEGEHNFADGGWTELLETDSSGKFYITEEGNYFLNDIPTWVNGLEFDVGGKITLCLNGHDFDWSSEEEGLIVGPDIDLHICDCGSGSIIGDIIVEGGSLELDGVNLSGGTVTVEEGSSLKVAGNTQVGSVYLGDDVTIECGELDNDADINIEVDDNSERGDPYVDSKSFSANNSGDVTNYFTMSDGSNPLSYRLKVVFPAIGEGETPYEGHYGTDWFTEKIKENITFIRTDSSGGIVSVDDIALDDDYEVTIYEPSGESEMKSVGEYTISVKLTDDGAKKYFFVGVSDSDGEDSEGGEIDSGTGAATMLYKVVKAPITVEFTDFASDEGFYNGNDWLDIIASSDSSDSGYISFKNLKSEETLSLDIDYKVTILSPDDTEAMINAGKYTVSVELIDDPRGNTAENYVLADESGEQLFDGATHEYTVKQVTMTISYTVSQQYNGKVFTVEGKGLTYNDLQIAYSPEGFEIEDTTIEVNNDISTTSADVGTYTGTLNITYDTVNFKLNGTAGYTLNIIPKVLSASNVKWDKTEFTYNGKAQQPTTATIATGVDGESDFNLVVTVDEGSAVNVGTYHATAKLPDGTKNYTLSGATISFTISKAQLSIDNLDNYTYNGTDQFPAISAAIKANVKNELNPEVLPNPVVVTEQSIVDAKTYSVKVTLAAGDSNNFEFTNSSDTINVTATVKKGVVTGIAWSVTAPASGALNNNNYNAAYDGNTHTVSAILTLNGSSHTIPAELTGNTFKNANTYTINVGETANYTVSAPNATFTARISKVNITIKGAYEDSKPYDGKGFNVSGDTVEAELIEYDGVKDSTLTVGDITTAAAAETYNGTIKITYDSTNYNLDSDVISYTLTITQKVLYADSVIWGKTDFTYNGTAQKPTASIPTGVDGEGNIDLKVDVSEGSSINVGNYNATAELPDGAGNYTLEGSATHEFAIGKATLTVELTADDKDYDGTDAVIVTGEITGTLYSVGSVKDVVTVGEIVAAFDDMNAGEKKSITVKSVALEGAAANNYEADFSKSLTAKINQLGIEITWDNVESLVYNGADQAPTPKLPAGIPDGSPALTVSASVAGGHKNAGTPYNATAVLEGTAKDNYIITGGGSQPYTINKATITLEGRYSASKTYDKNVYTGSITVTSDSDSGITATADNGLSESITVNIETNDVNAKTYDNDDLSIAYSGYDSTNYKIEDKANYSVEIEKANITVSGAYSAAKTYNGEGFSGEITAATASEDFTIETSDDTFKIIVSSDEVNCGEYTKAGGKVGVEYEYDEANYNAPYDTATYTLTIEKAKITFDKSGISITETEKTYDGNVSVPEVGSGKQITIITGVKEEEVNGTYTAVYNDKGVLNATEIIITLTLQAADNYEFGKSEGNYTLKEDGSITWTISGKITPAPLTAAVTAGKTIEKTYDGNTEITVVGENLTLHDKLGADDVIIQSASGNFEDANAGDNKDITLTIVLGGDDKDNYSISAQSVKGNITKADVSVTLSGGFTYDGETHSDNDILDLGNVSATFKGATTLGLSEANLNVSGSVKDYKDGGYSVGLKDSDENITVELIGNDNYTLNAADGTITVGKAQVTSITWTVTENAGALVGDTYTATYDGKTHTITAIVHYAGGTESASVDGDDTFKDVSDSGAYEIVKSANFDFDGVTTALTVTVNKASLTFTLNPASGEYDGTEHEINIQFVTQNGETLAKDADYTIEIDGGTPGSNGLPQGVGKYTVKVTLNTESAKAKNYTVTTESQEFTVSVGKVQKPTGASIEETYNGTAHNLTVIGYVEAQMSYSIDGDGADFAIATGIFSATNAGEYTLTISLKDGYEWDDVDKSNPEFTITIDKATLTITGATVETKTYDATTTATVTDMTFEGFKGDDADNVRLNTCVAEFESSDANDNVIVNITEITLKGPAAGNYTVADYYKTAGKIEKATITLEGRYSANKEYDGNVYSVDVTSDSDSGITASTDNELSESVSVHIQTNDVNAKTYGNDDLAITYSGYDSTNYKIEDKVNYSVEIERANITVSLLNGEDKYTASQEYSGSEFKVSGDTVKTALKFEYSSDVEDLSLKVQDISTELADVGSYSGAIEITFNETNFKLEGGVSYTLTIIKAKITFDKSEVSLKTDKTYDGNTSVTGVREDGESITFETGVNGEEVNGTYTAVYNDKNVLNATEIIITLTLQAADNYEFGESDGNYTLNEDGSITWTVTEGVKINPYVIDSLSPLTGSTYNGEAQTAAGLETLNGVNGEELTLDNDDYTVIYATDDGYSGENATNAGTYTVTVELKSTSSSARNYSIGSGATTEFTIAKAKLTIAALEEYTYNGADQFGTVRDDIESNITNTLNASVLPEGTLTVTIGKPDTEVKDVKTYSVSVTLSADDSKNFEFGGSDTATVSVTVVAGEVTDIKWEVNENTGKLDDSNYTAVYDGKEHTVTAILTLNGSSDTIKIEFGEDVIKGAKSYEITVEDTDNYTVSASNATFTAEISRKALSLKDESVSVTKVYDGTGVVTDGQINCPDTALEGVMDGDTVTISTKAAEFTGSDFNVGENKSVKMTVTLGGADADNYTIEEQTLNVGEITKAKITFDKSEVSLKTDKTYDGNTSVTGVSEDGESITFETGVNGEEVNGTYTAVYNDKNVLSATEIIITLTLQAADNYEFGESDGNYTLNEDGSIAWTVTGTINAKALSLKAESVSVTKVYDGTDNVEPGEITCPDGALDGVVEHDNVIISGKAATFDGPDFNVGENMNVTIIVTLGGADADNYTIDEQTLNVGKITKAQLTIDDLEEYAYNGNNQFKKVESDIKGKVKNTLNPDVLPSDVEVIGQDITDAKTYTVTVELSITDFDNFEFGGSSAKDGQTATVSVTVVAGEVTDIKWEVNENTGDLDDNNYTAVYDGKEHTVTAILTLNGVYEDTIVFEFGEDVIKDAKSYEMTVKGTANYTVSASNATFTAEISPYVIKSLPELGSVSYNGSEQEAVELNSLDGVNGEKLELGDDYTVEYQGEVAENKTPENADTYTVTVTLTSSAKAKNYELSSETATYIIEKAELDKPTSNANENKVSGTYKGSDYEIEVAGFKDDTMTSELSDEVKSQFGAAGDDKYKFTATDAGEYTLTITVRDQKNYKWADGESGEVKFTITISKADITEQFDKDGKLPRKQEYLYHADGSKHELRLKPEDEDGKFPLVLQGSDTLTDGEITYIIEKHSEADHSKVDMEQRLGELKSSDQWLPYKDSDNFNVNKPMHYVVYFKVEAVSGNYNVYYDYFTVLIFNEKVTITLKDGSNLPDVEYGDVDHTKESLIDDVFKMIEKVEVSADDGNLGDDTETWKNKLKDEAEHDKFKFYFRTQNTVGNGAQYEVGDLLPAGQTYYLFLQYIDGDESYITFEWKIGEDVERPGFNVIPRKINITVNVTGHTYGDTDFTDNVTPQTPTRDGDGTWYGEDKNPGIPSLGINYTFTLDDGDAEYAELSSDMLAGMYTVKGEWSNANYEITFTIAKYKVDTAKLTFTVTPPSAEYNGEGHDVDVSFGDTLKNGDKLIKDIDYTVEITGNGVSLVGDKPQNVGKYTVKVTLNTERAKAKNYTVTTESQEFTILVGKVEKPTGRDFKGTYNGEAQGLTLGNFTYNAAAMEYENTDDSSFATGTGVFSATNAGEYTLTISLKDGYEWSDGESGEVRVTITIDKATLTITGATVETKTYDGTTTATVTDMTFEGFKGADESNVRFVGCKAEFASPDASDSATVNRISEVQLTGSAADNYTVNVESLPEITGTIEKARLAIELTADKKTYDGTDTAIVTGKITGTIYSVGSVKDVVAVGNIVARFADANAGEKKSITVYSVALEGAAANNYEADYEAFAENLTADIERRDITITWDNVESLVYNGENQAPTPKLPAGIPDDTPDKLSVKAIVDGDHKNAGTPYNATAVLEGTAKDNYNITNADREFTIAKATVDVSWSGYEGLIYNGAERDITATATGVKGEEISLSVEYSAEEGSALNDNGKPQNAGNYTATADTANGNYTLGKSTKTQHFTVAKQQVNAPTIESTVYNGSPQTAHVETSVLYTAEEVVKTNAGNYDVRLTLTHPENYKWPNSEEADIVLTFTIRKADYDMSGVTFKDVTVDYDGEEHSIYIEGLLPDGVDVTYQNNGRTDVGVYTVTAIFTGDEINYNAIDNKTALLTILRVSHNLNEIGFNDVTVKYDGETHSIYIEGVLPHGVTVDYEGNGQTEPNIYTITAVFSDHIGEFERKTATLTILRLHAQSADGEVVIDSEDGFDPTLELVIEKIESVERGYWSWEKDKVSERYAVKLCKDGVEVPIDGKVTVRLLIPEAFGDKDFELKTVARAASIEYTRDGDYVVFETDGLSAYVFTRNYTPYFPIVFTATGVMLANVLVLIVLLVILKKKRETKVR